ncbi:type IV pilus modification PilV family protein [Thalassotalea piscium]|uniref:MSHA pilin protein MshD n=1 Tax=Thalassotalea piscium TaxID=1230533 RepID=A0A7X0TUZ7_9GAMM|nr:prepilin-type N-terminal cleavage/methylation domain-containing protein [Thalassotalea piscium]MBB6544605.1 MSHA pilin protein MshD [Thalassotalea piscium]
MLFKYPKLSKGFTLIETIVGIVVLSISFSIITNLIYPTVEQSADQLHQIRAAELGQSLLNEITGHAFDENSGRSGGRFRCNEDVNGNGTLETIEQCTTIMGNEEGGDRTLFDDVDDYNGMNIENTRFGFSGPASDVFIKNSQGDSLTLYLGYSLKVMVCNDSNYDGVCGPSNNNYTAKLITVTVTTPTGFAIDFSSYKANF